MLNEQYRGDTPHTITNLRLDRTQVLRIEKKGYTSQEKMIRWSSSNASAERNLLFDLNRVVEAKPRRLRNQRAKKRMTRRSAKPKRNARAVTSNRRRAEPPPPSQPEPKPKPKRKGKIRVQTRPWSSVYLNNRLLARETPVASAVTEGRYRLRVCFEGDSSRCVTRRIRVNAGRETLERFRE